MQNPIAITTTISGAFEVSMLKSTPNQRFQHKTRNSRQYLQIQIGHHASRIQTHANEDVQEPRLHPLAAGFFPAPGSVSRLLLRTSACSTALGAATASEKSLFATAAGTREMTSSALGSRCLFPQTLLLGHWNGDDWGDEYRISELR